MSISGEMMFHLRKRQDGQLHPIYMKIGYSYFREDGEKTLFEHLLWNWKWGKMFELNDRIGIYMDIGLALNVSEKKTYKVPKKSDNGFKIGIEAPFIPAATFLFYYRL